jgi:hypothetical protein
VAERVVGVDDMIIEALDIFDDMTLLQLIEDVKVRDWPASFKEFPHFS